MAFLREEERRDWAAGRRDLSISREVRGTLSLPSARVEAQAVERMDEGLQSEGQSKIETAEGEESTWPSPRNTKIPCDRQQSAPVNTWLAVSLSRWSHLGFPAKAYR